MCDPSLRMHNWPSMSHLPPVLRKNKDGVFGIDPDSVDADMLRVVETANDNPSKRAAVVEEAERNPRTLLGYQVGSGLAVSRHCCVSG